MRLTSIARSPAWPSPRSANAIVIDLVTATKAVLNNVYYGLVRRKGADWETDSPKCAIMVEVIGNHIYDRYE